MNARLDIDRDGARVTRDGRTYRLNVHLFIDGRSAKEGITAGADMLAKLAEDLLHAGDKECGAAKNDDAENIGWWTIEEELLGEQE